MAEQGRIQVSHDGEASHSETSANKDAGSSPEPLTSSHAVVSPTGNKLLQVDETTKMKGEISTLSSIETNTSAIMEQKLEREAHLKEETVSGTEPSCGLQLPSSSEPETVKADSKITESFPQPSADLSDPDVTTSNEQMGGVHSNEMPQPQAISSHQSETPPFCPNVGETGSFSAATREPNTSVSRVTKHISHAMPEFPSSASQPSAASTHSAETASSYTTAGGLNAVMPELPKFNTSSILPSEPVPSYPSLEEVSAAMPELPIRAPGFNATSTHPPGTADSLVSKSKLPPPASEVTSDSAGPSKTNESDPVHQLRWIKFNGINRPTITQNANGPCPMIAIANVLLLRGTLTLDVTNQMISSQHILNLLSDVLVSAPPTNLDAEQMLNYETQVSDALNIFPSLQTGLDINIRFTGVSNFEYTTALSVFDLFNIQLFHGWVLDPQDTRVESVIKDLTYNQVAEFVVTKKNSTNEGEMEAAWLVDEFLQRSASQLTCHGLCELNAALREGQLAVFFRNNHYSTIYKKQDRIYSLVTDAGFLNESVVVWETLNDVDGNTIFVNEEFAVASRDPPPTAPRISVLSQGPVGQILSDYELAKELAKEDENNVQREATDMELAKKLQNKEIAAAYQRDHPHPKHAQRQPARPAPHHTGTPEAQPRQGATGHHHRLHNEAGQRHDPRHGDKGDCSLL